MSVPPTTDELRRRAAVGRLGLALEELRLALVEVRSAGMAIPEALGELGIDVPMFAAPLIERAFDGLAAPEPEPAA